MAARISRTLGVRQELEVLLVFVGLDRGILADNASSAARSIEQYPIKTAHYLWNFTGIVVANDDVLPYVSDHAYHGTPNLIEQASPCRDRKEQGEKRGTHLAA